MSETERKDDFSKRDPKTFENIWNDIVLEGMTRYSKGAGVEIGNIDEIKRAVQKRYDHFNEHCSNEYMSDPNTPLDRHKVAACLIYAIVDERPLTVDYDQLQDSDDFFANERMALWAGYSLLTSSLLHVAGDKDTELTTGQMEIIKQRCDMAYDPLPKRVGHGKSYKLNLAKALCFTSIEQNHNILLLADILFLWECALVPEDCHKKILEQYARMARGEG